MNPVIAFANGRRIAQGPLDAVVQAAREVGDAPVLIFDAVTSEPVEVDLREGAALPDAEAARGRGRPKLGVTAREVTLLPRHWDWLGRQSGGASAALRRLVEAARRTEVDADAAREGRQALYRFATAVAGDALLYEDAIRALFAGDEARFEAACAGWPRDVRDHALALAPSAFGRRASPLDAHVPADRRRAVRDAIAQLFGDATVEAAEPLQGASGAQVFRFDVGGRALVLRLDLPASSLRDRVRHYTCHQTAAEAGVAPSLLHADAEEGLAITGFVVADPPPASAEAQRTHRLGLARTVRRLHDAPLFPRAVGYVEAVAGVLDRLVASGLIDAEPMARLLALHRRIVAGYVVAPGDLVSSHNDLNPSNVIFAGGAAILVDWDTAFAADRWADLAALANWFASDDEQEAEILGAYFGRPPTDRELARLCVVRQVSRLFYGAVLVLTAARATAGIAVDAAKLTGPGVRALRGEMAALGAPSAQLKFGCAFFADALRAAEDGVTLAGAMEGIGDERG
jgi:hypothetical protein